MRGRGGFTLIELLVAIVIVSIIGMAAAAVTSGAYQAWGWSDRKADLVQQGRFAMERMVYWTRLTNRVLLPFQYRYRDVGIARDVLAVAGTGYAVFDEDSDGLFDEDTGADATNDGQDGIIGVDDNADGTADNASTNNDDEDKIGGFFEWIDEDPIDGTYTAVGIWDDIDYWVDEDWGADMNGDGAPGVSGVDDDGDWNIDEGNVQNDDEDANAFGVERVNEDPISPIVFYLDKTTTPWKLMEKNPITGTNVICQRVTAFTATRSTNADGGHLVAISLTLQDTEGETLTLQTTVTPRNQPRLYVPDA